MAEDCDIGFQFITTRGGTDKTTYDDTWTQLNKDIGAYMAFDQEMQARDVQATDTHWDGNVPPDFTDGFDFIL
ncbi:hypothetical protein [Tropicibacter sp. S64]|uniref:hypothetical protein n=1 Tax=Tropicibacter sp. S64 TaxID=3415122 RepID=UPI003C7C5CCF